MWKVTGKCKVHDTTFDKKKEKDRKKERKKDRKTGRKEARKKKERKMNLAALVKKMKKMTQNQKLKQVKFEG